MWWLVACALSEPAATVRSLSITGVRVDLPAGFVSLPAGPLEEAARAAAPEQVHTLAAAAHEDGPDAGTVNVQRSVAQDAAVYGPSVADVLATLEERFRADFTARDPAARLEAADRDGGREVCGTLTQPPVTTCALSIVDAARRLVVRSVTCAGPGCAPIVASRRYAPEASLPTDAPPAAEAPPPSGLPGVGGQDVWGFRLGVSRAAFQSACAAAGHRVDRYDWSVEPTVVREWVEAGWASRCDGLPAPVPVAMGPAVGASAVFTHDRLMGLTVYLARDPNMVEAELARVYPQAVAGENQILHVIDEFAVGDALQSVTVFASGAPGAQASLTFLSANGAAR